MNEAYMNVIESYEAIVVEMDDPKIIKTALKLAYYMAMFDACMEDPLENQDEQQQVRSHFEKTILEATEQFQILVNEKL